jgi:hypothetical protein
MRLRSAMVLVLLLGCGGGGKKETAAPGGGGEGGGGGGGGPVTLVSVKADGGSCVAVVRDAAGEENSHAAAAELCPGGAKDASALVGKPVKLEMGSAPAAEGPALPPGEDPCRDIAPPCGGESAGGAEMVVGISAAS